MREKKERRKREEREKERRREKDTEREKKERTRFARDVLTEHFYACSDPHHPGPSGEGDRTREKREGERHEPKKAFRDEK